MKIKLTREQIQSIIDNPDSAEQAGIKVSDPWWLIALKVIKYICELIIAGAAGFIAVSCAGVSF